jgi:hypothetical protein
MGQRLRSEIVAAAKEHALAHIEKHRINVEVYLQNPAGVGGHSDIMDTIERELEEMAKYSDIVEIIDNYFMEH